MTTKIINNTDLLYSEIGNIIDNLNKRVDTNYVGKIMYYEYKIRNKIVCIQTEIQKTQFKIYLWNKKKTMDLNKGYNNE